LLLSNQAFTEKTKGGSRLGRGKGAPGTIVLPASAFLPGVLFVPVLVRTCPACNSPTFKPKYEFDECAIVRCTHCEFMWLNPLPTQEDTSIVYDNHYFENPHFLNGTANYLYGYVDYVSERINKQIRYYDMVKSVKDLLQPRQGDPSRWLDVGCGFGYLLDCVFDADFEAYGIEFNKHAVSKIKSKYTFDIRHGSLNDVDWGDRRFDVISMTDVIEHLHDPWTTIQRAWDLLQPGGILLLTTMDSDSLTSRLLGKRLEDFRRTREHLYFFSRKTLSDLLQQKGFQVIKTESYGHTFELEFLAERVKLISNPLGHGLLALVRATGLSHTRIYVDPRTKMLMLARKI
jgi:2-polyprenyl-3-methyl-5-hydroxy-6-metoxy-1,4-benzoquinol methylase